MRGLLNWLGFQLGNQGAFRLTLLFTGGERLTRQGAIEQIKKERLRLDR